MGFGKHKGERLCDIPDSYFVYIYDKGWTRDGLKLYIESNLYDKIDKTDEKGVEL